MELSNITHELSAIESKVSELQIRSRVISLSNGLRNGVWAWCLTLVVLGGLVLLFPVPGFVRASLVFIQGLTILWVFWRAAIGPILFRWGKKHWALYAEELHPRLDKRLVTCLDIAAETDGHHTFHTSPVAGLLLKETAAEIAHFEPGEELPNRRVFFHVGQLFLPVLLLGLSFLVFPAYVSGLFTALYKVEVPVTSVWSLHTANKAGVAEITINPGDTEIARGGTIEFAAHIEQLGKGDLDVIPELHISKDSEDTTSHEMLNDEESAAGFNLALVDVQDPFVYHATVAGLRTAEYRVTLYDPPLITEINAVVKPPEYSDDPVEELTGTFFTVLEGSTVTLSFKSDKPLSGARLLPDGDGDVHEATADGQFAIFTFKVDHSQSYRGMLYDLQKHENIDPPLIEFEAVPDKTPTISVKRPGADWALHPIGELELLVEVDDDNGLQDVQFEYQINDSEKQVVHLLEDDGNPRRGFTGEYTLQLEELNLALGDVVLYRFIARDTRPDQEKASSYSQPYFLTIRPFDQEFRAGDPAAGGGEAPPPMPNQKEIIIATTRLIDKEPGMDREILAERSGDTAEAQRVVEDRTHIALGKMKGANVSNRAQRVAHLEDAIEAMELAAESLDSAALRPALPKENSALSHLLAAYAGLPKGVPGQAQGSGSPPPPMGLSGQKLDRKTAKYETMDGLPQAATRELDEAIMKTKILAQRQKEFAETIRREREQSGGGGGGGESSSSSPPKSSPPGSPSQPNNAPMRQMLNKEDMLAALEESQRELQKLKDAMLDRVNLPQEVSKDLEQALQSAAQELKRLKNAMKNEDWDEAQGANTRALEKMREVQLKMQQAKLEAQSDAIQTMLSQVKSWKQEQGKLNKSTAALSNPSSGGGQPSRKEMVSKQADLGEEAVGTGRQVGAMTPMANDPNPPDYMKLGREMASSGRLMKKASEHIESDEDLQASRRQLDVMSRLEKLEKDLEDHMLNQAGDSLAKLQLALAAVQSIRDDLEAELANVKGSGPKGKLDDNVPEGGSPSGSPSDSESETPAQGSNGSSGSGGMSRIGEGTESKPSSDPWADGGSQVTPTRAFDKSAMTVRLETIERLLDPYSPAIPLVRSLEQIVASDMWAPPAPGTGAGDSDFIGEFAAILENLEDIMAIELAGEDQLQRLNQSGVENLPPRFRELASSYFESLASETQEKVSQND